MNNQIKSLSANITVELNGIIAITHYQLVYTNQTNDPIEAIYHMALPRMASVMSCQVTVNEQCFIAKLALAQQATGDYEDAITDGNRTVLLESLRDGLYAINIGNLAPTESIIVDLEIAQILTAGSDGETLTYRLPTTIAPTYGVSHNAVEPEHNIFARYPFAATLKSNEPISVLTSSHPIIDTAGKQQFAGVLDRDIFFTYQAKAQGALYAGTFCGSNYVMGYPQVQYQETQGNKGSNAELHLVVDRSGSMDGDSINLCKTALKQLLSEIDPGTPINITSFGSEYERLFQTAQPLTGAYKRQVRQHIDLLEANMGGTELESAVIGSLKGINRSLDVSHMIIITDGLVNLSEESFASIELLCHQRNVIIHCVGVGFSVNQYVVTRLAGIRDGISAIANPNEELLHAIEGIGNAVEQSFPICVQQQATENTFFHYPQRYYKQVPQLLVAQGKTVSLQANASITFNETITVNENLAKAIVQLATLKKMPSLSHLQATAEAEKFELLTQYTSFVMVDKTSVVENSEDLNTVVIPQAARLANLSVCESDNHYQLRPIDNDNEFQYLDMPGFLREQADRDFDFSLPLFLRKVKPNSDTVAPETQLLKDMNKFFWDPKKLTPGYLLSLQFSSTFIDSLSAIADIHAIPFNIIVLAYLTVLINEKETPITAKAKRRLSKTTLAMSPALKEDIRGLVGAETIGT